MTKPEKCVVVLSGGPDSATVAYWAKNQAYEVYALSFKYGQIAEKETESAQTIADKLDISLKILDLTSLRDIFEGVTSLCDKNIEMTPSFSQPIIVPFRNAIFLSIAVAYAISINAHRIFYGAQASDQPFYPDCRKAFYKSFERTARLGTNEDLTISTPFNEMEKSEVLRLGSKLGVPFELTWSCYLSEPKHCGKCESCSNRKIAFKEAEIQDPTDYIE
ncbi:MAG: 7-cyano-7-deazaguanine synthase QueC [Candidatus Bathyarchaeota archaeon]|nr:MAG: 7-cyano-7-deazaguanine synthase QueC [Candidatus Bathyarchaeota archaeon]